MTPDADTLRYRVAIKRNSRDHVAALEATTPRFDDVPADDDPVPHRVERKEMVG